MSKRSPKRQLMAKEGQWKTSEKLYLWKKVASRRTLRSSTSHWACTASLTSRSAWGARKPRHRGRQWHRKDTSKQRSLACSGRWPPFRWDCSGPQCTRQHRRSSRPDCSCSLEDRRNSWRHQWSWHTGPAQSSQNRIRTQLAGTYHRSAVGVAAGLVTI